MIFYLFYSFYLALLAIITFIKVDTSSYRACKKTFHVCQLFEQLYSCSSLGLNNELKHERGNANSVLRKKEKGKTKNLKANNNRL